MKNFKIGDIVVYAYKHKNKDSNVICKRKCKFLGKIRKHHHSMANIMFQDSSEVRSVSFDKLFTL